MELYEMKIEIADTVSLIFDSNVYTHSETPTIHAHSLYEFVYVLSDRAVIAFEQGETALTKGDLAIVAPGVYHQIKSAGSDLVHISFQVRAGTEDTKVSALLNNINSLYVIKLPGKHYFFILKAIAEKGNSVAFTDVLRLKASLTLLFADILEHELNQISVFLENTMSEQDLRRKKILKYINKNYNYNPSIKKLAQTLFLSEKQTQKQVLALTGKRFSYLVQEKRIACAKAFIRENRMTLDAVSKAIGYETYYGFAKAFKRFENMPPKKFQQLCANQKTAQFK